MDDFQIKRQIESHFRNACSWQHDVVCNKQEFSEVRTVSNIGSFDDLGKTLGAVSVPPVTVLSSTWLTNESVRIKCPNWFFKGLKGECAMIAMLVKEQMRNRLAFFFG